MRTFPGCRTPAVRCEIDHRIPFDFARGPDSGPDGGLRRPDEQVHASQTCEANLHTLCRHHHQSKTVGLWTVTYDRTTGVSTWTDRHGLTYARHPVRVLVPPGALDHRAAAPRPPEAQRPTVLTGVPSVAPHPVPSATPRRGQRPDPTAVGDLSPAPPATCLQRRQRPDPTAVGDLSPAPPATCLQRRPATCLQCRRRPVSSAVRDLTPVPVG